MPWLLLLLPVVALLWWLRRSPSTDVAPRRPEAARPQPSPRPASAATDLGYPEADEEPSEPLGYAPGSAPAARANGVVEGSGATPRHAAQTSTGEWAFAGGELAGASVEDDDQARVSGATRTDEAPGGWASPTRTAEGADRSALTAEDGGDPAAERPDVDALGSLGSAEERMDADALGGLAFAGERPDADALSGISAAERTDVNALGGTSVAQSPGTPVRVAGAAPQAVGADAGARPDDTEEPDEPKQALSAEGAEALERVAGGSGRVAATTEPATARWVGTAGAATAAGPDAIERAGRIRLDDMAPGTDAYTMTTGVEDVAASEEATEVQHALAEAATSVRRDFIAEGPHGPSSAAPDADGSGPEGWPIKADSTRMRFVLPGDSGYDSIATTAWFAEEEDARRAGFERPAAG